MTKVVVLDSYARENRRPKRDRCAVLSPSQRAYLQRGLEQPGGKLPLFDSEGQRYSAQTIRSCLDQGWAQPWFQNPLQPNWLICKLTEAGRKVIMEDSARKKTPA